MDGLLLPIILLASGNKPNQKALLSQILPAVLPGPRSQRMAVAAITARDQIKKQEQAEQALVTEAITAGNFKSADDFKDFPAFTAAFNRLPSTVQTTVFKRIPSPEGGGDRRDPGPT